MIDLRQVVLTLGEGTQEKPPEWTSGFIATARKRFATVMAAEGKLREQQMDDLRFRASEQWPTAIVSDRIMDDRPYLTINRIPQFIRQVTNAQRASKSGIMVLPVDNSDIKVAEVLQGIIRHIENQSDAMVAYITAAEQQVTFGRGYWRIVTEYIDDTSFDQEIYIRRIRNAFSVYMDPAASEFDGRDARYCFIVEDIPKDEFIDRYGYDAMASLDDFMSTGDRAPDWMPEGKIRICEYWYVVDEEQKLYHIRWKRDGSQDTVTEQNMKKLRETLETPESHFDVLRVRTSRKPQVYWCKISGAGVIEGNEDKTQGRKWPGKYIPIVPVIGDEIDINGEIDYRGMVRDAKDTQRLYNYQNTALAETLALAPKAPFIGYAGQFENHEAKWRAANRRNFPFLEVNPISSGGTLAPLPQRNSIEPPISAIVAAINQADNDLKSLMGLYEPSLGERAPSQLSGKAIQALQQQGNQANSNFADNLNRAIKSTGRILVDLVPHIYDAPRVLRIIGPDENPRQVMVHSGAPAESLPQTLEEGIEGIYDLGVGRYDVQTSSGPSPETKRQENLQGLLSIVQSYPAAFQFLGDLIVGDMDWPQAQAAALRLKKTLPPGVADDSGIPPEAQQQMAQMQQQLQMSQMELQQTKQALQQALQSIKSKQMEIQAEREIRLLEIQAEDRREARQSMVDLKKIQQELQGDLQLEEARGRIEAMLERLRASLDMQAANLERHHDRIDGMITRTEDRRDEWSRSAREDSKAQAKKTSGKD